jgi:hypothetical protein
MRQIEGQAFRLGRLMLCSRLRLSPHVSQNYYVKIAESNSLGREGGGIKINKKKLNKKMLYLIWKGRRGNGVAEVTGLFLRRLGVTYKQRQLF